jgi:hypothetical protein
MHRAASLTFADLIDKLTTLAIVCDKWGRREHYNVTRPIERYGPDAKLTDWLAGIAADCPKKNSIDMSDQRGAHYPDLSRVR